MEKRGLLIAAKACPLSEADNIYPKNVCDYQKTQEYKISFGWSPEVPLKDIKFISDKT
jgi:hypothetical protein